MPQGADTVVMQERAEEHVGSVVVAPGAVTKAGQNRRFAGEDVKAGDVVFHRGQAMKPAEIGMLASLGVNEVAVYRLFTRVRRDVWRRWLFLELEPEVSWPTAPPLGRHKEHAVTLRVEVAFDGRAREPERPLTP